MVMRRCLDKMEIGRFGESAVDSDISIMQINFFIFLFYFFGCLGRYMLSDTLGGNEYDTLR